MGLAPWSGRPHTLLMANQATPRVQVRSTCLVEVRIFVTTHCQAVHATLHRAMWLPSLSREVR